MKANYCVRLLGLAVLLAWSGTAMAADNRPAPGSAEFYKLQPEKFADKEIDLEVCFLRAFDRKSPIPELRFLHAMTYDKKKDAQGGVMAVVIPAAELEKMIKKYGSFPEGNRPWSWDSKKLTGTFRIAPGGHYYLDVSGNAAALIQGRNIMFEPDPMLPGKGGPGGPGPRGGGQGGGGKGPQPPQPPQTPSKS